MNNLVTALKENKDGARKKVIIATGITLATVVAGVVLVKLNADTKNVILVLDEAADVVTDATPTE